MGDPRDTSENCNETEDNINSGVENVIQIMEKSLRSSPDSGIEEDSKNGNIMEDNISASVVDEKENVKAEDMEIVPNNISSENVSVIEGEKKAKNVDETLGENKVYENTDQDTQNSYETDETLVVEEEKVGEDDIQNVQEVVDSTSKEVDCGDTEEVKLPASECENETSQEQEEPSPPSPAASSKSNFWENLHGKNKDENLTESIDRDDKKSVAKEGTEEIDSEEKKMDLDGAVIAVDITNNEESINTLTIDHNKNTAAEEEEAEDAANKEEISNDSLIEVTREDIELKLKESNPIVEGDIAAEKSKDVTLQLDPDASAENVDKTLRKTTPHPMSRIAALKKEDSEDVTHFSVKPNCSTPHETKIDDLEDDEDNELRKLSWDSESDERVDLGLEDGSSLKVQAWDVNSENGKYLTGLDAQRVIVEGMRKKVESMKTLMTPSYSTATGSVFNFPTRSSGLRASASAHSINSNSDEVFREDVTAGEGSGCGQGVGSRLSFSTSRSNNSLSTSAQYTAVGAMKNSLSPSPSVASLSSSSKSSVNPFSKPEATARSRADKSPGPAKKGPVVRTVKKKDETEDANESKPGNGSSTRQFFEAASKMKSDKSPRLVKKGVGAKKPDNKKRDTVPTKPMASDGKNGNLKVDESVGKKPVAKSPKILKKSNNISSTKEDSPKTTKRELTIETIKIPKSRSSSTSTAPKSPLLEGSKSREDKELKKPSPKPRTHSTAFGSTVAAKDDDKKMSVHGKKLRTPPAPVPLTDKEKFELLFEAYSKWGGEEAGAAATDSGITAYQLTRWLKNVELIEGKKVTNLDISVHVQRMKPNGKMTQEEMLKLVSIFAKNKKVSENWKQQLVDDSAWKIDLQQPSPVKKMFDPKELPTNTEAVRKKSTKSVENGEGNRKESTNTQKMNKLSRQNATTKKLSVH